MSQNGQKPTLLMTLLRKKPKTKFFLSLQTKRLVASFLGLNSFPVQTPSAVVLNLYKHTEPLRSF